MSPSGGDEVRGSPVFLDLLEEDPPESTSDPAFVSGGGEEGELTRAKDVRGKDFSRTAVEFALKKEDGSMVNQEAPNIECSESVPGGAYEVWSSSGLASTIPTDARGK